MTWGTAVAHHGHSCRVGIAPSPPHFVDDLVSGLDDDTRALVQLLRDVIGELDPNRTEAALLRVLTRWLEIDHRAPAA